jgi:transposase
MNCHVNEFTNRNVCDKIRTMEMGFHLSIKSRTILEEYHRACSDKKTADRIKAILLMADGFTYQQIRRILLLDERTLNRYKKIYNEEGIDGLVANNYHGRHCKLSEEQINHLKQELDSKLYATAESVCEYVLKTFDVHYTPQGMVQTLRRLGYRYKKTTIVPGKMDPEKQKSFVIKYKRRYKNLPKEEKVYFMDGSHPTYNSHAGYGWISVGKRFALKSQTGRLRLNLMGAYDPKSAETIVREYDTLNKESTIDFLRFLKARNSGKKIHIICDNVRYQYAKAVREEAKKLKIRLVYLPCYSPNLNLIERYWGFLKKKVIVNRHYETFEQFKTAILTFSKSHSKKFKRALLKYIPEKFHLLQPAPG